MVVPLKTQWVKWVPLVSVLGLSACVTENYENDKTQPIVQNQSSKNDMALTRISLGLGYLKMGNTTQAKLNLEKAKFHAPNLVQVHTAFAHYYETVGEPELATDSYEDALTIAPDDADTLNNFGVFLCRQGQYQAAETQIEKAIAQPSYLLVSQSYENLALCQIEDNRFDDAQASLEKAILHNPSSANVYLQMMTLQYAKGDYLEAKAFLKRYEKATRRLSPEALALAYKIYFKQGQRGTAKNYANMLVKMFPNSFEARQYILNGLDSIHADKLAEKYKLAQVKTSPTLKKKRVVLLSPNKSNTPISQQIADAKAKELKTKQSKERQSNDKQSIVAKQNEQASMLVSQMAQADSSTDKSASDAANSTNIKSTAAEINTSQALESQREKKPEIAVNSLKNKLSKPVEKSVSKNVQDNPLLAQATVHSISVPMHLVKKGDSLFYISKKYNIQIKAIKRWNNWTPKRVLKIGDMIYLDDPKKVSVN